MRDRSPLPSAGMANQDSTIDLVISPAVVRVGNSDGIDYNLLTCLVKMDVLYDVSLLAQQQPTIQPGLFEQAQPVAQGQPAALPGHEKHDGDHISVIKGGVEMEEDAQISNHGVARSTVLPAPQPALPASTDDCPDGSDSIGTRLLTRPSRSSALAALLAMGRKTEEEDELAGCPVSDADGDSGSKPSSSRKRRAPKKEDEAYVPGSDG